MISFDEVKYALYYQAGRYAKRHPEHLFEEFLSIAWLSVCKLKNPKFASQAASWAIQCFLRKEAIYHARFKQVEFVVAKTYSVENFHLDYNDRLNCILRVTDLNTLDRTFLYEYFYLHWTYKQIGIKHNLSRARIHQRINACLKKLKQITEERNL